MERLTFFTSPDTLPEVKPDEPERDELHMLIDTLPIEQVRKMLAQCRKGRQIEMKHLDTQILFL